MKRRNQAKTGRARLAVTVRLDDTVLSRIDELAASVGTTRSSIIEDLLARGLPRNKKKAAHESLFD